ncbi:unnamed protein product, partial [Discosporangium mesarthrocarpum]
PFKTYNIINCSPGSNPYFPAMASTAVAARVGDTLNQAWKNDKSKFGFRMLEKMGWKEGKGLGKNEDGMASNVKVIKKADNLGLGAKRDTSGDQGWASTTLSYSGVLEALGKAYANKASGNSAGSDAGKKQSKKGKLNKDKQERATGSSKSGPGSTVSVSACPSRAKRIRSKDVKGFSSTDLRAILGHAASPELPTYPVLGQRTKEENEEEERERGTTADEKEGNRRGNKRRRRNSEVAGHSSGTPDEACAYQEESKKSKKRKQKEGKKKRKRGERAEQAASGNSEG